jgi:hypothetical protein
VRIVAASDGVMTLEAVAITSGTHPPLEVEVAANGRGCACLANPGSISVAAGTEVKATIEIDWGSPSQSFTLTTSMAHE